MKSVEVFGLVDENHRLSAVVPAEIAPGRVRLVVSAEPDEDEVGSAWAMAVAREWSSEWSDPGEDIYTPEDGGPVNGTG
jgi:hypothetical protein